MIIKPIRFEEIPSKIISEGKRFRLIFKNGDNVYYFGGFLGSQLVSLTCLVVNKNKTASIKSNYTLPEYRNRGYFTKLNRHCLNYAREHGVKHVLLNCLKDSVGIHKKAGAQIWKATKTIFWMVYKEGGKWPV